MSPAMHRSNPLLALLFVLLPLIAVAQDGPAPDPPAEDAAADKPGPPDKPEPITDPAVLTILESQPQTPADQFSAIEMLARLGHPELAQPLLKKLIDANMDDLTLAALAEKFGTPTFLQFARIEGLRPEAEVFSAAVLSASDRVTRDPARLKKFVQQLSSANEIEREDAVLALRRAGSSAVGPLFTAITDPARAAEHAAAREMVLRLAGDSVAPLSMAVEAPRPAQQAAAIELLGLLGAREPLPLLVGTYVSPASDETVVQAAGTALERLLGRVPSQPEALKYLERHVRQQIKTARLIEAQDNYGGEPGVAEAWHWDDAAGPVVSLQPEAHLARASAARAARHLAERDSSSSDRRHLYLSTALEEAKFRVGLDNPLEPALIELLGAPENLAALEPMLVEALATDNTAVAVGVLEGLAFHGSLQMLESTDGRPTPLVSAARSGDRRVRAAAINALIALKPLQPFAGASAVSEGLQFLASSRGQRRALVAHPRSARAQQWAGYLTVLGYDVDIATNGRDAFKLASSSPDYELALLHVALDRPRTDELLNQLRKESRTAKLPVGLIAIPDYPESAARLASGATLTHAFAEPQDAAAIKFQVERLLNLPGAAPIPPEVRKQHAASALKILEEYAEQPVGWLNARGISRDLENSLYAPETGGLVASLLASAGTATGQSELVQLAGRETLPRARREAAALAFSRSVLKHGVLLTSDQILAQYDRYNENAGRNRDTHRVMSIVLAALESKSDLPDTPDEP